MTTAGVGVNDKGGKYNISNYYAKKREKKSLNWVEAVAEALKTIDLCLFC